MFKIHELREIIRLIDQSSIQEFELNYEDVKIVMKKNRELGMGIINNFSEPVQTIKPNIVQLEEKVDNNIKQKEVVERLVKEKTIPNIITKENLHKIVSPMVGTFYRAPAPDASPYVQVGDKVNEKTIVCIVEAMKLMNEIEAEVKGEIVEILVENGQLVEFGQPLFLVRLDK